MQAGTNVYLMTQRGTLMPGTFVGYTLLGTATFAQIEAPGGKIYTCAEENVLDEDAGRVLLYHRRAEQMAAEGYRIAVRNDGTFRVYQPKKHGLTGGYIVGEPATGYQHCTCPACAKDGICKHIMSVCSLLWNKAANANLRGWRAGATRYENLAVERALAA